jgi:hypothetical protein
MAGVCQLDGNAEQAAALSATASSAAGDRRASPHNPKLILRTNRGGDRTPGEGGAERPAAQDPEDRRYHPDLEHDMKLSWM